MNAKFTVSCLCLCLVFCCFSCGTGSNTPKAADPERDGWRDRLANSEGDPLGFSLAGAIPFIFEQTLQGPGSGEGEDVLGLIRVPFQINEDDPVETTLDKFVSFERLETYLPGMGLTESIIREQNGDYAGAVIAFYKEFLWNYSLTDNAGESGQANIRNAMRAITDVYGSRGEKGKAGRAAQAILNFMDNDFTGCSKILSSLFAKEEENDSFTQWLLAVCSLENGEKDRSTISKYTALKGRYKNFPYYWYYMGKNFETKVESMNAAELCINLASRGPCSGSMRVVLAKGMGLPESASKVMLTLTELDNIITGSIENADVSILDEAIPMLSLPNNAATSYLMGAFYPMAAYNIFNAYFVQKANEHGGLIAERLRFVLDRVQK